MSDDIEERKRRDEQQANDKKMDRLFKSDAPSHTETFHKDKEMYDKS